MQGDNKCTWAPNHRFSVDDKPYGPQHTSTVTWTGSLVGSCLCCLQARPRTWKTRLFHLYSAPSTSNYSSIRPMHMRYVKLCHPFLIFQSEVNLGSVRWSCWLTELCLLLLGVRYFNRYHIMAPSLTSCKAINSIPWTVTVGLHTYCILLIWKRYFDTSW